MSRRRSFVVCHSSRVAALAAALALAPACGVTWSSFVPPVVNKPGAAGAAVAGSSPVAPPSRVGQLAIYGRQFTIAASAAVDGVDKAMTAGVLPRDVGISILTALDKVATENVTLARILTTVEAAKDHAGTFDAVARARVSLRVMQLALSDAAVNIANPTARAVVDGILATINALMSDFSGSLMKLLEVVEASPLAPPASAWPALQPRRAFVVEREL